MLRTPLRHSPWLSRAARAEVFLKLETLQPTHSYKVRGATNAVLKLAASAGGHPPRIVTASAGNHGRAMAHAAAAAGLHLTVYVPEGAPKIKIDAIREAGADLRLCADYDEAERRAKADGAREAGVFISPYAHPDVIAGAGTVALEILEDLPEVETIVAAVGGGGLVSGMALGLDCHRGNTGHRRNTSHRRNTEDTQGHRGNTGHRRNTEATQGHSGNTGHRGNTEATQGHSGNTGHRRNTEDTQGHSGNTGHRRNTEATQGHCGNTGHRGNTEETQGGAIEIAGVEVEASTPFTSSLKAGRIVEIEVGDTLADGLSGNLDPDSPTFELVRKRVARIAVVSESELIEAIRGVARYEKLIIEGAAAAAVAAVASGKLDLRGRSVAIVLSGANIDLETLKRVLSEG